MTGNPGKWNYEQGLKHLKPLSRNNEEVTQDFDSHQNWLVFEGDWKLGLVYTVL